MRPLVSRFSQIARSIALDQSSKILHQNRITSRSPLVGVLRLSAQRASFAPTYFARYQIRAQHTGPDTHTTGVYKKNKIPLGKHYGIPVTTGKVHGTHYGVPTTTGKVHSGLKTTDQSSQPPKVMHSSPYLVAEKSFYRYLKTKQLLERHSNNPRREYVCWDTALSHFVYASLIVIMTLSIENEVRMWRIPTEDEKVRRHKDILSPIIASLPCGKNEPS